MNETKGIIIVGSAGAGKTTLGKLLAKELGYVYFDLDDYIWRTDTKIPYTKMYTREEKISRLMNDILQEKYFVMGGSMSSFNEPFIPFFELAIHLIAPIDVREARLRARAECEYGDRVLKGGDMFEENEKFIESARNYDSDGSPSMKSHSEWIQSLPCKKLLLDGAETLEENIKNIVEVYKAL